MWWYKIPVLLAVASANHISLSDQKITKLRFRSRFVAYSVFTFKGFFWTLTACEVTLIWSVNHPRSSIAHRILVVLVHPLANFPPKPHISLPFAVVWSITLLSLAVHLRSKSHYRRIRQSSESIAGTLAGDQLRHVRDDASGTNSDTDQRRRTRTVRRILLGSSPVVGIGSAACCVLPGSFPYECWVWRMAFGGPLFCFMQVSYVAFWLVMVVWRCVRSRRRGGGGREGLEPVEGVVDASDTGLEEDNEELIADECTH